MGVAGPAPFPFRPGVVLSAVVLCVFFPFACRHATPPKPEGEPQKPEEGMRHLYEGRSTIYRGDRIDVRIIPVARIAAWDFLVRKGGGVSRRELAAYVYLLRHPVHGNILIDLGYPEVTAEDPAAYPGFPVHVLMKIRMNKEDHVARRIGRLGLGPEDIRLILFTHLHVDHMGDIRAFPSSRMLVHQKEWEAALQGGRSRGYRSDYLQGLSPQTFSFPEDTPYGPFERSLDVLGDGSVIAVSTPGHTVGHVSYFVHTGHRTFFLAGDAAWVEENYREPTRKGWFAHTFVDADRRAQKDTLLRIHTLYREWPDVLMVPGHDGGVLTDESLMPYVLE